MIFLFQRCDILLHLQEHEDDILDLLGVDIHENVSQLDRFLQQLVVFRLFRLDRLLLLGREAEELLTILLDKRTIDLILLGGASSPNEIK